MEELKSNTKLPTFEEIERYNDKSQYKGYEFMLHLTDNLYLRISVQNEKVIFPNRPNADNIIYFSLCTGNEFPIYNMSYMYCEEAYNTGLMQIWSAIDRIQSALSLLKGKL